MLSIVFESVIMCTQITTTDKLENGEMYYILQRNRPNKNH